MSEENKRSIQLKTAICLCVVGVVLILMSFWVIPIGEIHNSILVAVGEIFTFSGSLFGIDYHYRERK